MPQPLIQVRQLTKEFGRIPRVRDVDLLVPPGEVVALLGPNGAGKTTLLRILAGMLIPDRGSGTVAGHDLLEARRQLAGVVGTALSSEHAWSARLSGRHNLEVFAALAGVGRREVAATVGESLASVNLTDVADRRVGTYSRGMRSRLAIARARLNSPRLLLLDEPTANLDMQSALALMQALSTLDDADGIVFTTHSAEEAAAVAHRVLVMRDGQIVLELTRPIDAREILIALGGSS